MADRQTREALDLDDPALYGGIEEERERTARRALLEWLVDAGVSPDRLRAAASEEALATLPFEAALGGEQRYTLTAVARAAHVDPRFLRKLLLALGRPNPRPRERAFTDADIETAKTVRTLVDLGLPREGIVQVARVLSMSLATTAAAMRELGAEALIKPGDTEYDLGLRYAQAAEQLVPLLGPMLERQLVVHLTEGVGRDAITRAERDAGTLRGTRTVAVAFADLVGFTRVGEQVAPEELGRIAGRIADAAAEVARPPVALVKTIGDAAMFVSTDVGALLDALAALVGRFDGDASEEDAVPPARAGVAYGEARTSGGDWFGPAVNLASRITGAAKASTIMVDAATREAVVDEPRYDWSRTRRLRLKGVRGWTRAYRLRLGDGDEEDDED